MCGETVNNLGVFLLRCVCVFSCFVLRELWGHMCDSLEEEQQ